MKTTNTLLAAAVALCAGCVGVVGTPGVALDYGDNSSTWAFDGECDDPRFEGPGTDEILLAEDAYHDAADCSMLMRQGSVWLSGGGGGGRRSSSGSCDRIDFGNNSSTWSNDGECDDPRFAGPGTASVLLPEDAYRDANDCRSACYSGSVWMR